ncbi:MAG TPA: cation diffusion facilitator family transporter, partial [Candidatus Acidoferrales bacterium]|nr:cation diffusion facilitator family transporter [Candidatus Acidoferrales bacterium]
RACRSGGWRPASPSPSSDTADPRRGAWGGILSHSLALLADAGHVTTDIFALALAWFAVKQTERPADEARSFGYHRAGILAAMANGATLIVLVFIIAWEAAQRFVHPEPVQGGLVILAALAGVGVNTYIALSFRKQSSNLNIRAAVLHAFGDLLASVGVILAGAIILFTGWLFIDPLVSVFIAALIGWNAFKIVGETVNILLEGTPRGTDLAAIRNELAEVPGVVSLHDLHVWAISSEHKALSAHVVVEDQSLADSEHVMREIESRHRIDEDQARSFPRQGDGQALGPEHEVKALLIGVTGHPAKALSKGLGVAVSAARTHLVAARDRVPRGVRPLDPAVVGHGGDDRDRDRYCTPLRSQRCPAPPPEVRDSADISPAHQ